MKIGIVTLTYNGHKDTLECLSSLSRVKTTHELFVVVVDNGSRERFAIEDVRSRNRKCVECRVIHLQKNRGFSGGNNAGIAACMKEGADAVILINNDTLVSPDIIDKLVAASETYNHRAVIGPKIYFAKGYEFHPHRYTAPEKGTVIWYAGGIIDWKNVYASHRGVDEVDTGQYDTPCATDFITGCCMYIPASVIRDVGVLDDRYFLYYEDADFCMRARANGYALMYEPSAVMWHKNAQSSGSSGSDIHVYYQTRNRLMFGVKYAPVRTKLALMRESLTLAMGGGVRRRAVVDFYLCRWGKGSV